MTRRAKGKPGRILVVEDDWDILEVLKLMLEYEGHHVSTAKHGQAALALASGAARPFDLVVLDISMPGMSGIEVAQALRAAEKTAELYIVIHTGLDEHWVQERFADYDVFLTKAQDADVLVEEIARLLAEPRAARRRAGVEAARFSADEVARVRAALRTAMGLGPEAVPLTVLVGQVAEEIEQLRRLGKSDVEIAALMSAALGRSVAAAALAAPA